MTTKSAKVAVAEKAYLALYIAHLRPDFSIEDVVFAYPYDPASTAIPRASIGAASQPATSPTARACARNQGGGSREISRAAASIRVGTVIRPMVPDGP